MTFFDVFSKISSYLKNPRDYWTGLAFLEWLSSKLNIRQDTSQTSRTRTSWLRPPWSDLIFSLRIIYACLGTLRRKIFFSRDCPIYHTKSRINCITFILEILFQYRWVPRTRPRERCTRLFVACLIIIVQEHTWILVKLEIIDHQWVH